MAVPKCKGSLILEMKRAVRRGHGQEALDRVTQALPEESREIVGGIVLGGEFYPETVAGDLLAAAEAEVGDRFPEYARELAKNQINGVLRFLLRLFANPKRLAENNDKLWRALHDTGSLAVTASGDYSHTIELRGFVFPNATYERAFVEFHCGVLEVTGARNVTGVSTKVGPATYVQKYEWEY